MINTLKEIKFLLQKDILLEWRQQYAFYSVLLYLISTIFIAYLSIGVKGNSLSPATWNAIFWIIILFSAVSAVAKSFMQESKGRNVYYYMIASPQAIILSKIIFNILITSIISFTGIFIYSLVLGNIIQDPLFFCINLILGSAGFASTFTLLSGISAKAGNNTTLMAILSIPIVTPILILLINVSKNCIDGLDRSVSYTELLLLFAMNVLVVSLSYLLFPYLWKS